jgi:hypothetical protein
VPQIVPLISRFANSQNKVNAADFSANGKFHQQLEELSRTVWAPATSGLERGTHWYYERARGSYADDKSTAGKGVAGRSWVENNPPEQKITKTDLAKFEHAWRGQPHLVCLGAEKNFVRFAEQMEDEGELLVDLNYFKLLVGKAILWRSAEKLFDTLDLDGYRANSVAYAVAWLAEKSARRIDLMAIWEKQCLSTALSQALKAVCKAGWDFLTDREGNVGEASKREECWQDFRELAIEIGEAWMANLAAAPFGPAPTDELEALAAEWERVRHAFVNDSGSIGELEVLTGKTWNGSRRNDSASCYARLTWSELRELRPNGDRRIRSDRLRQTPRQ